MKRIKEYFINLPTTFEYIPHHLQVTVFLGFGWDEVECFIDFGLNLDGDLDDIMDIVIIVLFAMGDLFDGIFLHDDLDGWEEGQELFGIDERVEILKGEGVENIAHELMQLGIIVWIVLPGEVLDDLVEIFGGGLPMLHVKIDYIFFYFVFHLFVQTTDICCPSSWNPVPF